MTNILDVRATGRMPAVPASPRVLRVAPVPHGVSSSIPAAHHLTHEPGGSDALTSYLATADVNTITRRGTRAEQPVASSVVAGTLYCITDERFVIERSTGSAWELWTSRRHAAIFPYDFSNLTTAPPTSSQVRINAAAPYTAATKIWIRLIASDGRDVYYGLMGTDAGTIVRIQDRNDHTIMATFTVTSDPIDRTTYIEWPVSYLANSGAALLNNQTVLVVKQ